MLSQLRLHPGFARAGLEHCRQQFPQHAAAKMNDFQHDVRHELLEALSRSVATAEAPDLTRRHGVSLRTLELHSDLFRAYHSLLPQQLAAEEIISSYNPFLKVLSSLLGKVQWGELIVSHKVSPSADPVPLPAFAATPAVQIAIRIRGSLSIAESAVLLLSLSLHSGLHQTQAGLLADVHILHRLSAWPSLADALETLLLDVSQPLPAASCHLLQDLLHVRPPALHATLPALAVLRG